MPEELVIGLSGNLILIGITCLLIIVLHSISQRRLKKKGLTNEQLKGQWDKLARMAKGIEEKVTKKVEMPEKVTKPESALDLSQETYRRINEVFQKDESEIETYIKGKIEYAEKKQKNIKELILSSCGMIDKEFAKRGICHKELKWGEVVKEWSQLPKKWLEYLLAFLKKTKQIIIKFAQDTFSIELINGICFKKTVESFI